MEISCFAVLSPHTSTGTCAPRTHRTCAAEKCKKVFLWNGDVFVVVRRSHPLWTINKKPKSCSGEFRSHEKKKKKKPKAPPWKVRWVPAHVIIDISLRSCSCSSCFSTLRRGDFFLPLEQNHKHTFSLLRIHICRRVVAEICREIVIRRNCAGRCVDPWTSAASSVVAWTILSSFLTGAFSGKRCAAWREAKSFN